MKEKRYTVEDVFAEFERFRERLGRMTRHFTNEGQGGFGFIIAAAEVRRGPLGLTVIRELGKVAGSEDAVAYGIANAHIIARAAGYIDAISTAIDFYEFRSAGSETPAPAEGAAKEGKAAQQKGKRRKSVRLIDRMPGDFGKHYKDKLSAARLRLHFREFGVHADETGKASYESALEEYYKNRPVYDRFVPFAVNLSQTTRLKHGKWEETDEEKRGKEPKSLPPRVILGLAVEMSVKQDASPADIRTYFNALGYGGGGTILGMIYDGFHPEIYCRGRRSHISGELTGYIYDGFVDYLRHREEMP